MNQHAPHIETVLFLVGFLICYLAFLVRNTVRSRIDLYDLLLLSSVAIVPCGFVLFPRLSYAISDLLGVAFPFVLLFGLLFLLVFVLLYRLVKRLTALTQSTTILVQEVSLLQQQIAANTQANELSPAARGVKQS